MAPVIPTNPVTERTEPLARASRLLMAMSTVLGNVCPCRKLGGQRIPHHFNSPRSINRQNPTEIGIHKLRIGDSTTVIPKYSKIMHRGAKELLVLTNGF